MHKNTDPGPVLDVGATGLAHPGRSLERQKVPGVAGRYLKRSREWEQHMCVWLFVIEVVCD